MTEILDRAEPEDLGLSSSALQRIGQVLARDVEKGRIPGAVALVARRGRIAYFESVGYRDKTANSDMEHDAIFRVYSMTKPLTSVAAMMLCEEGHFNLAHPISRYIPELQGLTVAGGAPAEREITIQDIFRHTSGFSYGTTGDPLIDQPFEDSGAGGADHTNAELMGKLAKVHLAHHPAAGWEYGRSTEVLGRLVEVVSGQSLDRFFQDRILDPLGMSDSGFSVREGERHRIAQPFPTDPDSGEPISLIEVTKPPKFLMGGAGLVSTAADYARFAQMLLDGGAFDGHRLLSPKTVAYMASDHLAGLTGPRFMPGPGYGFGLGFYVRLATGVAPFPGSVGDFGWNGVAGTSFWVDPKEELIAVLLTQAPALRLHYRMLFRNLVYAAL